jgi:LytS/YehU family sensor histidine kinase
VENAIKHGVEPSADGGTVTIAAHRDGDAVTVTVTDTGRGLVPQTGLEGHGVGLANVRERLAALYGGRGRFTLEPATPRGMRATLSVPFEEAVPA